MDDTPPRLLITVGDASGDAMAAALVRRLRSRRPKLSITGVGGPLMREAGVFLYMDSSDWSAIGWLESIKSLPGLIGRGRATQSFVARSKPDLWIGVDFGSFNVRVARTCRRAGVRSCYLMPPGSWNRRYRRNPELARVADAFVTPFPWQAESLQAAGARAWYVGHPLVDMLPWQLSQEQAREQLELPRRTTVIALFPGSRRAELECTFRVQLNAVRRLRRRHPDWSFAVAPAPTLDETRVRALARQCDPSIRVCPRAAHVVMRAANAGLVTSGTATLEAACLDLPMVVVYDLNRIGNRIQRRFGHRLRFASLPNIILQREAVRELLGWNADPKVAAREVERLVFDFRARQRQRSEYARVRELLGPPGAIDRMADIVVSQLPCRQTRAATEG